MDWEGVFIGFILGAVFILFITRLGSSQFSSSAGYSLQPIVSNTEKWEWIDYKGRKRYIIVRREVH